MKQKAVWSLAAWRDHTHALGVSKANVECATYIPRAFPNLLLERLSYIGGYWPAGQGPPELHGLTITPKEGFIPDRVPNIFIMVYGSDFHQGNSTKLGGTSSGPGNLTSSSGGLPQGAVGFGGEGPSTEG